MGKIRSFLVFFVFLTGLIFATNSFAVGYSCPTYVKYATCNPGFFLSKNGAFQASPEAGNACTKCPDNAVVCHGGTEAPVYDIELNSNGLAATEVVATLYRSATAGFCTDAENCVADGSSVIEPGAKIDTSIFPTDLNGVMFLDGYYASPTSSANRLIDGNGNLATNISGTLSNTVEGPLVVYLHSSLDLELNPNGGTGGIILHRVQYKQAATKVLTLPTRSGYTLLGYYDNPEGTGKPYFNGSGQPTFATWESAQPKILYAIWGEATYTVTYNANGGAGTIADSTFQYDIDSTLSENSFTREGYTFAGWNSDLTAANNGEVQYANNATISISEADLPSGAYSLYAVWAANKYTITYDVNGGTSTVESTECTYDKDCTLSATIPTRVGYAFGGWTYDGNTYASGDTVKNLTATNNGSITMTAVWNANQYTVSFNPNGGTGGQSADITVTYDATMPAIDTTAPYKSGAIFAGWAYNGTKYYEADGSSTVKWNVASNTTLTAVWTARTEYTVIYNANGGNGGMASKTCTYGADCVLDTASALSMAHHAFNGWATSTDGAPIYTDGQTINVSVSDWPDGVLNLYATWTPYTLTIKYDANGGNGQMSDSVFDNNAQSAILSKNTFVREHYTFGGWATSANGAKVYDDAQDAKTELAAAQNNFATKTLYAVWNGDNYTVTYDANGGTGTTAATTVTYPTQATLSNNGFSRIGYHFAGWAANSTAATAQYQAGDKMSVTGDTTLYAVWAANKYTITYDVNGGTSTVESTECTYDKDCTLSATIPTRVGYAFGGWTYDGNTYASGDTVKNLTATNNGSITMTAVWNANEYTLSFDLNGGTGTVPAAIKVRYNNKPSNIAGNMPTKAEMIFTGYEYNGKLYFNASGVATRIWDVASDATLTASWTTRTQFTVVFNKNGGTFTLSDQTCEYGDTCTLTKLGTNYTMTGHTFGGWALGADEAAVYADGAAISISGSDAPDGILNLYAVWVPNTMTYKYNANGGAGQMTDSVFTFDAATANLATNQFTRDHYTFVGWATSANGAKVYDDAQNVKSEVAGTQSGSKTQTLYAVWNGNNYTVTYSANGGTGTTAATTVTYPTQATLSNNGFNRIGYHFVGWAANSDATTAQYQAGDKMTVTGDITLYAVWTMNKYDIAFNGTDGTGTGPEIISATYGQTYTLPDCTFVRTGYSCAGWKYGETTYKAGDRVKNLTDKDGETVMMTAVWTPNTYTVTLVTTNPVDVSQKTIKDVYLVYDTGWYSDQGANNAITNVEVPTYDGYGFGGYITDSGVTVVNTDGSLTSNKTFTTINVSATSKWTAGQVTCAAGTYYLGTGTQCSTECQENHYCPGVTVSVDSGVAGLETCPTGYPYADNNAVREGQCYTTECKPVANGTTDGRDYFDNSLDTCKVVSCENGYYLNDGVCSICEAGKYCNGGTSTPILCPKEYPNTDAGAQSIEACYSECENTANADNMTGRAYYGDGDSTCEATSCVEGYYVNNGTCVACPAGSFCTGEADKRPETCPADYPYSDIGATDRGQCYGYCQQTASGTVSGRDYVNDSLDTCEVTSCAAGYYLVDGVCTTCPQGSFCVAGTEQPETCPASHPYSNTGAKAMAECYKTCEGYPLVGGTARPVKEKVNYPAECQFQGISDNGNPCTIIGDQCVESSCSPDHEMIDGMCYPCERDGAMEYESYGNCLVKTCINGMHPNGQQCEDDVKECQIAGAYSAQQTWNPVKKAFGPCTVTECEAGSHIVSNMCQSDEQTCELPNGIGMHEWNHATNSWGECIAVSCDPGYTNDPSETNDPTAQCGRCKNMFSKDGERAVSSYVQGCEIASCMYQGEIFALEGGECVPICEERSDETGSQYRSGNSCIRSCNEGFMAW